MYKIKLKNKKYTLNLLWAKYLETVFSFLFLFYYKHIHLLATVQVVLPGALGYETFPAMWTCVRPDASMHLYVVPVRRTLREALPAILAHVRFLPGVHPHVAHQLVLLGEPLLTDDARVGVQTGVDLAMIHEFILTGQPLPADVAQSGDVHFLVFVLVVPAQAGRELVADVANGALVPNRGFARDVGVVRGASVRGQVPRKGKVFPAHFTLERGFAVVEVFVLYGVGAYLKSFSAYLALVLGGTFVCPHVTLQTIL